MKKFNFTTEIKGCNRNRNYVLKTNKNFIVGNINRKFDISINNKYITNKYLKLNTKLSRNTLNSILYNIKNLND